MLDHLKGHLLNRLLVLAVITGCSPHESGNLPIIPAVPHAGISVDGSLDDWETIPASLEVAGFLSPWVNSSFGQTEFRAIADSVWLYFSFGVEDSLLISVPFTQEHDVASGDRVEIFLSGDSTLGDYYCLEMGPYGDVLDYRAAYYRQFDNTWDLPGLAVAAQTIPGGYVVEGRIPLSFLRSLSQDKPSGENMTLYMGLYRAEYHKPHTEADPVQWLTWVDPGTDDPDFHVPSSFYRIQIQKP